MLSPAAPAPFLDCTAELGEGLLWHPELGTLWWVDITRHLIAEWNPATQQRRQWHMNQTVSALVPAPGGQLLAILADGIYRFDPTTGVPTFLVCPPEHDAQRLRFNDAKCDPQGRLWAGTLAHDGVPGQARLYRIDADGSTHVMLEGVDLANGLAWSPAGDTFYFVDSLKRNVQAFDFDGTTGNLSRPRIALDLSAIPGVPDGCTIDTDGNLWIAHWDGARISRWNPTTGEHLGDLTLPVQQVTNCTFGGPDLDQLYITTAACGLTEEQQRAQPLAGRLFTAPPATTGYPAHGYTTG